MPLPVWYLEFKKEHGREPAPNEMRGDQRRILRECCVENLERARRGQERRIAWEEVLAKIEADPTTWHEIREELELFGYSRAFMEMLMREGPDALLKRVREAVEFLDGGAPEHWERVLRDVVGLEGVEAGT